VWGNREGAVSMLPRPEELECWRPLRSDDLRNIREARAVSFSLDHPQRCSLQYHVQTATTMSQPKTLIYAEQLSNIRQISIIATLNTPSDSTTNAKLSANSQQIILHHGGETTTLDLPGQVASSAQLQKPVLGRQELSWRLPTAGQPSRADLESTQSIEAPWSAKSLGEDAEFACKECGNVVVKKGIIKTWKDLPSENWAEMMDFWHCHKPDVEPNGSSDHASEDHVDGDHVHGTSAATRRYGANTKFLATPGVGFVDITTFLLSESDCTGIALTGISAANQVRYTSPLVFSFVSLEIHVLLGIKKAAKPAFCDAMAWSPIQMPKINTMLPFCASSSPARIPSSSVYGFGVRLEVIASAFHSVSSSRSWKAMGLARGTFIVLCINITYFAVGSRLVMCVMFTSSLSFSLTVVDFELLLLFTNQ
jgi:hypothetical protein